MAFSGDISRNPVFSLPLLRESLLWINVGSSEPHKLGAGRNIPAKKLKIVAESKLRN